MPPSPAEALAMEAALPQDAESLCMVTTSCAICTHDRDGRELYPANFSFQDLNVDIFSARRRPDRIHYRLVQCKECGLVRSNPVADANTMATLYENSRFDYANEVTNIRATYGRYLRRLERHGIQKDALMEIGCGNGFFLEEALSQGYAQVYGVEPSHQAIAAAREDIRPNIRASMMTSGLFEPESLSVICLFQVLDHIGNPADVLAECYRLLKPGGMVLCLNHNIEAVSARLLGERSPIVDIEHTYLYSPQTLGRLFQNQGFRINEVASVWNHYSLRYLFRLLPLPSVLSRPIAALLNNPVAEAIVLPAPLGNLYLIAQKA